MRRRTYAASERRPPGGSNDGGAWLHADVTTSLEIPRLTAQDRCDACGAQAYVRVELASGELLFCAHHARKHADALARVALSIQDETARLDEEAVQRIED